MAKPAAALDAADPLFDSLDRIAAAPSCLVHLRRLDGSEYAHVGTMPGPEFNIDAVQQRFGGGKYEYIAKPQSGPIVTRGTFTISGPPATPAPISAAPAGVAAMTPHAGNAAPARTVVIAGVPVVMSEERYAAWKESRAIKRQLRALREQRAPANMPAPPTFIEQMQAFAQSVGMMKQLAPPPPPPASPLTDTVEAMNTIDRLAEQRAGKMLGARGSDAGDAAPAAGAWLGILQNIDWEGAARFTAVAIEGLGRAFRRAPEQQQQNNAGASASPERGTHPGERELAAARSADAPAQPTSAAQPGGAEGGGGTPPPPPPPPAESTSAAPLDPIAEQFAPLGRLVMSCACAEEPNTKSLADVLIDIFETNKLAVADVLDLGFAAQLLRACPYLEPKRAYVEALEKELESRIDDDDDAPGAAPPPAKPRGKKERPA